MALARRLHHVAIEVSDMDGSIQFYRDLLGLKLSERHAAGEVAEIPVELAFLRLHDNHHDLVLAHNPTKRYSKAQRADQDGPVACHHIAFEYPDRDAWLAQLEQVKALGIDIIRGPIIHSAYQPGGEGSWGENESFYLLDPDEHRIEMFCNMGKIDADGYLQDGADGRRLGDTKVAET